MDPTTRTFFVAGVKFRPDKDIDEAVSHIRKFRSDADGSVPLRLVGEPGNRYDRYAVKVIMDIFDGEISHIGYVPKPINVDIWALRGGGMKPVAKLVEFNEHAPSYEMFKVEVTFHKP
jgi:hypothetical protein